MCQSIDSRQENSSNFSPVESSYQNTCSVMNTLKSILLNLSIPEEFIREDTLLHKDLQLDSVEVVEIALGLKRTLGVNVKLESRQDMTLAQVCNTVKEAIAQNITNHVTPTY
ncbi:acyl carrier protein [Plectonema radiosum NIES-515]|uniref:Acyl carrier protein n=1 Tax=Plectonema radiosum NIES-515 TaxID=2986073 RepID=A0ABT3B5I9_9CYAN|nr:acyl carrier protein [Plectonema radiosum]MCV3216652.1 acyl carrier protein [Plectonema radiosum NIES-515]